MNLLPCPFCGGSEKLVVYSQEWNGYYESAQVQCENDNCLASGPMAKATSKAMDDTLLKQQAIELWNRRATLTLDKPGYRITEENAMAFDYPNVSTSVHFWMAKNAVVFRDDKREPQNGFIPVIIYGEDHVWMSSSVLIPIDTVPLPPEPLTPKVQRLA